MKKDKQVTVIPTQSGLHMSDVVLSAIVMNSFSSCLMMEHHCSCVAREENRAWTANQSYKVTEPVCLLCFVLSFCCHSVTQSILRRPNIVLAIDRYTADALKYK